MRNPLWILVGSLMFVQLANAETVIHSFDALSIKRLEVTNSHGRVLITGQNTAEARVLLDKRVFGDTCVLTVEQQGNTLVVDVRERQPNERQTAIGCEVDIALEVPRRITQIIRNGIGNVMINETHGDLDISIGAGEIDIADVAASNLDAKSGAGNLRVSGLVQAAEIKLGAGSLELIQTQRSKSGRFDIRTGTGDATIRLPRGTSVNTSFTAGMGKVDCDLVDRPDASHVITMRSGAGNLDIRSL